MKKIKLTKMVMVLFILGFIISCNSQKEPMKYNITSTKLVECKDNPNIKRLTIVIIDSCEYIQYDIGNNNGVLTHKGNCRFCERRLKPMLP